MGGRLRRARTRALAEWLRRIRGRPCRPRRRALRRAGRSPHRRHRQARVSRPGQLPPARRHQRGASGVPRRPQGRLLREQLRRLRRATSGRRRCLERATARTWRAPTVSGRRCGRAPRRSWTSARCPAARPRSRRSRASSACARTWARRSARRATPSTAAASSGSGTKPPAWPGSSARVAYIKEHDGAYNGRIKAMLYPGQLDTCTPDLLRQARRVGRRPRRADTAARRDEPARVPPHPRAARADADPAPALDRIPEAAHRPRPLRVPQRALLVPLPVRRRPEAPGRQRRHGRPRAVQVRQDGRAVRVVRALSRARDQHRARHRHLPARSDPRDALGRA